MCSPEIIDWPVKVCCDLPLLSQLCRRNICNAKFTFHFDREYFFLGCDKIAICLKLYCMSCLIGGNALQRLITFKYLPAMGSSKKVCHVLMRNIFQ